MKDGRGANQRAIIINCAQTCAGYSTLCSIVLLLRLPRPHEINSHGVSVGAQRAMGFAHL
jgi:hypothetical protein